MRANRRPSTAFKRKIISPLISFLIIPAILLPYSEALSQNQVWFTPNEGSVDMLKLFIDPGQWPTARSKVNVFKFYSGHLSSQGCTWCGSNTLSNLVNVQAFSKLNQWGIDIAIETPYPFPVRSHDTPPECATSDWVRDQTTLVTKNLIQSVQSNGGVVRYLAMDEPIRKWYPEFYYLYTGQTDPRPCLYTSLAKLADDVAEYITRVKASYPSVLIRHIELYPQVGVDQLKEWIIALEERGVSLSFLHLDVHGPKLADYVAWGMGVDIAADLRELKSFLEAHNVEFGIIFSDLNWQKYGGGDSYYDDKIYYGNTLEWIDDVQSAIGEPDHSIFQSWVPYPFSDETGVKEIPINLPENDSLIYSHTRLIKEGLEAFRSPATGVFEPPTFLPEKLELLQNYPNPFNPETTIHYSVANQSHVQIKLHNTLGQHIRTLVDEQKVGGDYSVVWDGRDKHDQSVASGIYFYEMRVAGQLLQKKLILLR